MPLKITILSGGSGNDNLIKGLKSIYNNSDIKVITNLYDSGKSTGICRQVTNTLGVSDVRKNHSRLYSVMTDTPNKSFLEFYNNRYNLKQGEELVTVIELLHKWNLSRFDDYAVRFFSRSEAKKYIYDDFSIANIIYSEMYAELGYEETNKIFCNLLGIDDFVLCNSFDNVYLKAITQSGHVIEDEGDLVKWCNADDKIIETFEEGESTELNKKAVDRILDSDLIIISTGTFWSSIYPTLQYLDFYKYINESSAKKIWAINNEEDKDAYGVSSNEFISKVSRLGLNLNNFTILENLDAIDSLQEPSIDLNIIRKHMGNNNGKHNGLSFATEIFKIYYNLNIDYDNIIFDFDDTLWARDYELNPKNRQASIHNIMQLNSNLKLKDKAIIISGNTYDSISRKLYNLFGTNLDDFDLSIWADSNSKRYYKNNIVDMIVELMITKYDVQEVRNKLKKTFNLDCTVDNEDYTFNIKIRGLNNLERKLLASYLNDYLFNTWDSHLVAKITGTTTVDILHEDNDKTAVFKRCNLKDKTTLYIGDETSSGNDCNISKLCTNYINVSDVTETEVILSLLGGIRIES